MARLPARPVEPPPEAAQLDDELGGPTGEELLRADMVGLLGELEVLRIERTATAAAAERYYRDLLNQPASLPWADSPWKPRTIGPTWKIGDDGRWILPELTLGWVFLGWTSANLEIEGEPITWTPEQARFWLWWFAVDSDGRWLYRDATLQRLKGWGKDPMAAALAVFELVGPCRVDRIEWVDGVGVVYGRPHPVPWVDVAAVTQAQTKTTMRLLPEMVGRETQRLFRIREPGKLSVWARRERAFLQAVTSNPSALEGNRPTLVILNESHHWLEANSGHDMAEVLERNTTKAKGGSARRIRFTNAFERGQDSVAERTRDAYDRGDLERHLYDTLEAPRAATLEPEVATEVVNIIKGDSWWLDTAQIVEDIKGKSQDAPAEMRRYWYNQVEGAEDAWMDPRAWMDAADDSLQLIEGDSIVIFGDGSKSDDATAVVACRVRDGAVFLLGVWQRPAGSRKKQGDGKPWRAPRRDVDRIVRDAVRDFDVWGIWFDPSAAEDDVAGEASGERSYWMPLLDTWHERWGEHLVLVAGDEHSTVWDMRTPEHHREFTKAAMQVVDDVERLHLRHPGDKLLYRHVTSARARPNKWGVSLGKQSRTSRKKIDAAVCVVGARMMRRKALTLQSTKERRGGRAKRRSGAQLPAA